MSSDVGEQRTIRDVSYREGGGRGLGHMENKRKIMMETNGSFNCLHTLAAHDGSKEEPARRHLEALLPAPRDGSAKWAPGRGGLPPKWSQGLFVSEATKLRVVRPTWPCTFITLTNDWRRTFSLIRVLIN